MEEENHGKHSSETESRSRDFDIRTRVYSFTDGMTLDYVYELEGETLMIWGGEKGSPMYYKGTFSDDGQTVNGGWNWPGGGYTANMIRHD
jgi:hypothetical protein